MNQESKVINVHLEKRENKDYLVFGFEEAAEVCLNDDESQNNLKSIFVKLLTEITKYPIELQFLEKPEYKTGLYIDVCKEYIKDLEKVQFEKSTTKVIKNIDGKFYNELDNMVEILSNHIVSPVRFDKAIKLMEEEKVDTFVEIGPGKTLTGFIKKELNNINTINIYDVESLENAIKILKEGEK